MEFALLPLQLTGPQQQIQGIIRAGTAGAFASLSCQHKPRLSAPTEKRQRHSQKLVFCLAAAPAREPPTAPWAGEENELLDCVIVGGGIGGLSTAMAFATEHTSTVPRFLITEARERVGGNINSHVTSDGYTWEEGPNSFQPNDAMLKAAVEAGVDNKLVFGDPKAPRFVWWQKKLRPTPSGPDALTFDLLSIGGKLRAAFGAIGMKPKAPGHEETVEQFVRRNLGNEVFERLIEPFCSGVYAGSPNRLSMKAAFGKIQGLEQAGGSLVGGAISMMRNKPKGPKPERDPRLPEKPKGQTVGSFNGGLQVLPDGMAKRLNRYIRKGWVLRELRREADGVLQLHYDTPEGARRLRARSASLTIPAHAAADILRPISPSTSDALSSIDYPPVAAVAVSYPLSAIKDERKDGEGKLPGFGQLHPRSQGITTLGTIYSSSLFPGRCPEGQQLLLNYFGGTTNRKVQDMSSEEVVAQVDRDLKQMLLKADAPAPHVVGYRLWPRAIPQFNVGHLDLVQGAQDDLKAAGYPEVFLGGNYMSGVALGKCVEYGYTEAAKLSDFLSQSAPTNTNSPDKAQDEAFYGSVV